MLVDLKVERINRMKKKVLFLTMGLCITLLVGGCAKKGAAGDLDNNSATGGASTVTGAAEVTGAADITEAAVTEKEKYIASDYITLGEYKGLAVTVEKVAVTDTDVETAIIGELAANATTEEVTDRTDVQNSDVVNIDYEGLLDGVAFDGGTATGFDLTIGSNSFIEGFESGLIGKKVGETVKLDLTFPEDYGSEMAGKAVVFNVKINSINKTIVPELTDDYIKTNTDYASIEDYRKAVREKLEATNEQEAANNKKDSVIMALMEGSTISSYPKTLVSYYATLYESYVTQTLYYYNSSLEEYLASQGKTQEEFDAQVQTVAENNASLELIERAIAEKEGLTLTDEEFQAVVAEYMVNYGAQTQEVLFQSVSEEAIRDEALLNKALDMAINSAVVTEVEVTPTPAAQ